MPASDLKTGTFVLILNLTLQKGISKKLQLDRKGLYQITENLETLHINYLTTTKMKQLSIESFFTLVS